MNGKLKIESKLEILQFISNTQRQQLIERRHFEWKAFTSLVTFFVLSVVGVYTVPITITLILKRAIWILWTVLTAFGSMFLVYIHIAHQKNRDFAHIAEHNLDNLLRNETCPIDKIFPDLSSAAEKQNLWQAFYAFFKKDLMPELHKTKKRYLAGQLSLVWLFALGSAFLITNKPSNEVPNLINQNIDKQIHVLEEINKNLQVQKENAMSLNRLIENKNKETSTLQTEKLVESLDKIKQLLNLLVENRTIKENDNGGSKDSEAKP